MILYTLETNSVSIKMGIWTWTMKIGTTDNEATKHDNLTNNEWDMEMLTS